MLRADDLPEIRVKQHAIERARQRHRDLDHLSYGGLRELIALDIAEAVACGRRSDRHPNGSAARAAVSRSYAWTQPILGVAARVYILQESRASGILYVMTTLDRSRVYL